MARRWIAVSLLVFWMMVCLTGCGIDIGQGIVRELTEHKDSILQELLELKDDLMEELEGSEDDIQRELRELVDNLLGELQDWSGSAADRHNSGTEPPPHSERQRLNRKSDTESQFRQSLPSFLPMFW